MPKAVLLDASPDGARTHYLHINVVSFLKRSRFPADYANVFAQGERSLSADEAHAFLLSEHANGHEVIPVDAGCGNPCTRAADGCTGFQYDGKGCPGHSAPCSPE
ncbi:hypothetical protein [Sinimarinibacterium sp. CAU 1509]|uniref:hypothetical protein n=1 Tax=Sinimarinibacterium sp. CAU 1509 TaxID=2562283 RepID=UPI001B7FCE6F|nr:hypothetical protein [Sinimarinibacterium sp. CAU 1509]